MGSEVPAHFDLMLRLGGLPSFEELTCLDLGCGTYNTDVAKTVLEIPWKYLTSVDGYRADLDVAAKKKSAAKKWKRIVGDVRDDYGKFDVILSFDVLEHLTHEDGEAWLEKLESAATQRVVLHLPIEPDGFHRDNIWENPLQDHLSHWKDWELSSRGYTVQVTNSTNTEEETVMVDGNPQKRCITFNSMWAIKDLTSR